MVKKADIPDHVIDTALALAAEGRWADLSLAEIAEAAEVPIAKVYPVFPSKQAIVEAFVRRINAAVLAESTPEDLEGSARDRLFDVIMRCFDALDPHKDAVANVLLAQGRDPLSMLCTLALFRRSMALVLEAAGLSSSGLRGVVRIKGLSLIYLSAFRVWLRDDTADKARTMAALDTQLRRAEAVILRLRRRARPGADEAGGPAGAPA